MDEKNKQEDPVLWVLLPKDPADLQYNMEPLFACLNPEAANQHRESEERSPVRYVPDTTLKRAQEAICRYMVALGPHMADSWKELLVAQCGLVIDESNPYRHPIVPKR